MKQTELIEVLQGIQVDLNLCSDSLRHHAVSELESVGEKIAALNDKFFYLVKN